MEFVLRVRVVLGAGHLLMRALHTLYTVGKVPTVTDNQENHGLNLHLAQIGNRE